MNSLLVLLVGLRLRALIATVLGPCVQLLMSDVANALTLIPGDLIVANAVAFGPARANISVVDPVTGAQSLIAADGLPSTLANVVYDPSGDVFVCAPNAFGSLGGAVLRVGPMTGQSSVFASGIREPMGLTLASNGDLLVVDRRFGSTSLSAVIRIDRTTGEKSVVSQGGYLNYSLGIAVEDSANFLVASGSFFTETGSVIRINASTGEQSVLSEGGLFVDPMGIAVAGDGSVFVVDDGGWMVSPPRENPMPPKVIRVNPLTGAQEVVTEGGLFQRPVAIAIERDGSLVIADAFSGVIRVDTASGVQELVAADGYLDISFGIAVVPIPEPSTALLVGLGLAAISVTRRKSSLTH